MKHNLWSSVDGGYSWQIIGTNEDKNVLIQQRSHADHHGPTGVEMVILPDGQEPEITMGDIVPEAAEF